MNKVEQRFYEEFSTSMNLKVQPHIFEVGKISWFTDFLDLNTNIYYEVVGNRATYTEHYQKEHFSYMLKHKYPLIIAAYLKKLDTFFLFNNVNDSYLPYEEIYKLIANKQYVREYGDGTVLYPVNELTKKKNLNTQRKRLKETNEYIKTLKSGKTPKNKLIDVTTFNSSVQTKYYKKLRIEAVEANITIKKYIAMILECYVKSKYPNLTKKEVMENQSKE